MRCPRRQSRRRVRPWRAGRPAAFARTNPSPSRLREEGKRSTGGSLFRWLHFLSRRRLLDPLPGRGVGRGDEQGTATDRMARAGADRAGGAGGARADLCRSGAGFRRAVLPAGGRSLAAWRIALCRHLGPQAARAVHALCAGTGAGGRSVRALQGARCGVRGGDRADHPPGGAARGGRIRGDCGGAALCVLAQLHGRRRRAVARVLQPSRAACGAADAPGAGAAWAP